MLKHSLVTALSSLTLTGGGQMSWCGSPCSPGSSLQPKNSCGSWLCGAAGVLPLRKPPTPLPINGHGNPGWRLFLDPRNFKTTHQLPRSFLLPNLLLFLTTISPFFKKCNPRWISWIVAKRLDERFWVAVVSGRLRFGMWSCLKSRVVLLLAELWCN